MVWTLDEPLGDPAPLNVLYISQLASSRESRFYCRRKISLPDIVGIKRSSMTVTLKTSEVHAPTCGAKPSRPRSADCNSASLIQNVEWCESNRGCQTYKLLSLDRHTYVDKFVF